MKTYHICTRETLASNAHLFCASNGHHYLNLPSGDVIACCNFDAEVSESRWARTPGVQHLPHPMYEGTTPVQTHHYHKLKHLGVEPSHTILDVARIVGAIHPCMRLMIHSRP